MIESLIVVINLCISDSVHVLMGQAATLLPQAMVKWTEVGLFVFFGVKLLWQASQMSATAKGTEAKAEQTLAEKHQKETPLAIVTEALG